MRRYQRAETADVEAADRERQQRFNRFRQSNWALRFSAAALALGAALLAAGIGKVLL
jgi:hypothetical protein